MYEDIFQFIRNEVKKRNLRERMVVSFDVCRQWIIFTKFDNKRAQKFSFRKDEMDMIVRFWFVMMECRYAFNIICVFEIIRKLLQQCFWLQCGKAFRQCNNQFPCFSWHNGNQARRLQAHQRTWNRTSCQRRFICNGFDRRITELEPVFRPTNYIKKGVFALRLKCNQKCNQTLHEIHS